MIKLTHPIFDFFKQLLHSIFKDDCPGLAAEMAFHLMLSFIPAVIFILALFGLIEREYAMLPKIMQFINQWVPPYAFEVVRKTIKGILEGGTKSLAIASFTVAFWTASNGAAVVIKGLSRAYGIPQHRDRFWYRRLLGMFSLIVMGIFVLMGTNLIIIGDFIVHWLDNFLHFPLRAILLINITRWTLIYVGIMLFTGLLYAMASSLAGVKVRFTSTLPGAAVFLILLIFISKGFSYYVISLAPYNKVYGILGAVIILMVWLYLSAFALLIGGEINAHFRSLGQSKRLNLQTQLAEKESSLL